METHPVLPLFSADEEPAPLPQGLDVLRTFNPSIGIVLGSGLGSFTERLQEAQELAYSAVGGLPAPYVPGHAGRFVWGRLGAMRVLCAQGRAHLYEGHSPRTIGAQVRLMADCGVKTLILTNAAGCLNPRFLPGKWMLLRDHINLTGASPLTGSGKFIDMTEAYSKRLITRFLAAASKLKVRQGAFTLFEGVYAGVAGPQYETPAEVRMLRLLGADAVGMSTVMECIQARALGLDVAGFSCLTNWAAGMSGHPLSHDEVLAAGKKAASQLADLLLEALSAGV